MAKETAETEDAQTVVWLGNRSAVEIIEDPLDPTKKTRTPIDGPKKNCTTVKLAPGLKLLDAARVITDAGGGVWQAHSNDESPAWVASTNPALASVLSEHFGGIEVREPQPEQTWTPAKGKKE